MKETGIVRKLDELGRITLPIELRRTLNLAERDSIEISTEEDRIVLKKYEPVDIFTGVNEDLIEYCGKKVSRKSILEMAKIAGISGEDLT
ncbi:MAG TPA: AbrB family transcriptional regulator [Lachnospiraceae bacterium]|nr:AbrB family transcriptional regulator [Lachnospiraceae bacterium]